MKDYLEVARNCFDNAKLEFEIIAYPTASAAMEAVKNGEIDCMFPANLTDFDGETQGNFMTAPIMTTDISAIIAESEKDGFSSKEHVTVAVNAGNSNYNMFLVDNFPEWRSVIFKDTPECLKAISEGRADCILMSNYRTNNVSSYCKKYNLTVVSTGVKMEYSFAVRRDNTVLYSIMNKVADVVPSSTINAALSYYFTEDAKESFGEILVDNIGLVLTVFLSVVALLLILLLYNVNSRKKALASQKLIKATVHDPLTGLYNKSFFYEYAARMYRTDPTRPMDAVVINIEQFHAVNALKLDRAFVKNIERDTKDDRMVAVILDIAKTLNIPVIAEGVETTQQLKLLKDLGCEYVQGFYFSRPLPASEFEDTFLKNS